MEIKNPSGEIYMETNHVDKRILKLEFLYCAWSISSKYTEKSRLSQCIEIMNDYNLLKLLKLITSLEK